MQDGRVERGRLIAASRRLRETPDGSWLVASQTLPKKKYVVVPGKTCTCPDFQEWELDCKHIYAVKFAGHPIEIATNGLPEIMPPRQQYPQKWAAYNQAQVVEKDLFQTLLHDLCSGIPQPVQTKGRPRIPLSDAVFASVMKVYVAFSSRRASTDIRECQAKGHLRQAPHYNSILNYLGKPEPKRMFEAESHYQERLKNGEPKHLFEADAHFIVRTKARCITEHDGRIAARCNEYPGLVGYGKNEDEAMRHLLDVISRGTG